VQLANDAFFCFVPKLKPHIQQTVTQIHIVIFASDESPINEFIFSRVAPWSGVKQENTTKRGRQAKDKQVVNLHDMLYL
jgi:hypothetical protein